MEGDNFFFKWILFNEKFGVKEKNPENPDFNGFGRFFHLKFPPQQLICQMSAQLVMKMSGKI